MIILGWLPHADLFIGFIVSYLVKGSWKRKLLYSVVSASIGLLVILSIIIVSSQDIIHEFKYTVSYTLEVIIIQLLIVTVGAILYLVISFILNL